jgi:hypothetical protein
VSWSVFVLIVVGSIFSLNVTLIVVFVATPVAPFAGLTALTPGAVVSDPELVLNDDENVVASALPAKSLTRGSMAPPSTLRVKFVAEANVETGVRIAIRVAVS